MQIRSLTLTAVVVLASFAALAQERPGPTGPPEEMRALDILVGHWKGEGWTQRGPQRMTFTSEEIVEKKLGGAVLVVEGKHFGSGEGPTNGKLVHDALGVFSYDASTSRYRFQAYLGDGRATDAEAWFEDGKLHWKMQAGPVNIRYVIEIKDKTWTENGEMSMDGTTWRPFFGMTLERVD